MTETAIPMPNHRDTERALRGVLARLRGDHDVLPLLAAECETPTDVDMMICAAFDCLVFVLSRGLADPVAYLAGWIEQERQRADAEEQADD